MKTAKATITIDRQAMLALYVRDAKHLANGTAVEQLAHTAMCHAILDGTMDYDPATQTVQLTDNGLRQFRRHLLRKGETRPN